MHTTCGKSKKTIFLHNGNASGGNLIIRTLTPDAWEMGKRWWSHDPSGKPVEENDYTEIVVEYDDVAALVAEQIRMRKITTLEQASVEEILGA